jgi:hypothetical protein
MGKRKSSPPPQRVLPGLIALGVTGIFAFAACVSQPAAPSENALHNIDDARKLGTVAATNLSAAERQLQVATAEANRTLRATEAAFRLERERQSAFATQTADEQNAQAARAVLRATSDALSASATATAQANTLNAQATAMSLNATATAITISQDNARRAAEWEQGVLIPARTIALILIAAVLIAAALRFVLKAVEALILHIRVVRDGNGNIMVIMPEDKSGRQQVLQPHLSAAPVTSFTPAGLAEATVRSSGGDPDVLRRAQLIDAMKRVTPGAPAAARDVDADGLLIQRRLSAPAVGALDDPVIQVIEPAQAGCLQLADVEATAAIDSDWRSANDDV